MRVLLSFISFLCVSSVFSETDDTLTTVAALTQALQTDSSLFLRFDLTATLIYAHRHPHGSMIIRDKTGTATLWDNSSGNVKFSNEGKIVRICGQIRPDSNQWKRRSKPVPVCDVLTPLTHADPLVPLPIGPADLRKLDKQGSIVLLTGILRDAFQDEIEPNFTWITLNCEGEEIYADLSSIEDPHHQLEDLLGETVALVGFAQDAIMQNGERKIGYTLSTHFEWIRPQRAGPADPFDVPDIPDLLQTPFRQVLALGRHKAVGFVVARWEKGNILLKTEDGRHLFASIVGDGRSLPDSGSHIVVSGIPETDSYHINLRHSRWRMLPDGLTLAEPPPHAMTVQEMRTDEQGQQHFNVYLHGQTIALRGRLIRPASGGANTGWFSLEQDGEITRVDYSATKGLLSGIDDGSIVEVRGTCIMTPHSGLSLPRIDSFFVVPRSLDDIRLIARPPLWTMGRVLVALPVIAVLFVGVLIWSAMLRRLSERRGEELAKEKLCVVESKLKVCERTRLAIELHDLLSQMLSGISMQIGTVRKLFDLNRDRALYHLGIAEKTLLACRENLRDCLWDLRNHTIEESDMSKAIRDTLEPHADDIGLSIRFVVPRNRLSDTAAHAILSIIRELVVNAIRHGSAKSVKIAGSVETGRVLFSVADNGIGFDPETAPGMAQGHFGLQGIRERVEGFGGDMTVYSAIGQGTKVTIGFNLPQDNTQNEQ